MAISLAINDESFAIKHSVVAIVLLTWYGGAVCPFVDSLPIVTLFGIFTAAFIIAWISKYALCHFNLNYSKNDSFLKNFWDNFQIYLVVTILVISFNFFVFEFPLASGLKILIGIFSIGLFASIDNLIEQERKQIQNNSITNGRVLSDNRLFPVTKKLSITFGMLMLITAIIIGLVVIKDTDYLLLGEYTSKTQAKFAVLFDVIFVIAVLLLYGLRILHNYSKNLALLFNRQLATLSDIHQGNLQTQVPINTTDEFAYIARGTNEMIKGLLEKERIRTIFGKAVSPEIASKLIETHAGNLRKGSRKEVVILFCDIRGFTEMSEKSHPQAVLDMLNVYFDKMVSIVHKHDGIVDKFIGDAILAVFGIDNTSNFINKKNTKNSVAAAIAMSKSAKNITMPTGKPLKNGFGIHCGSVFAGTVGSTERFEFTVIGDTVNTASRLEGLCKTTQRDIIISKAVFDHLDKNMQDLFEKETKTQLKGKTKNIPIFGYK